MRAMAGVNRRRRWRGSALAATAGLMMLTPVLGACGGGASGDSPEVASIDDGEDADDGATDDTTDDTTETSVDPEEAMLAYTECMRDNGVDMPDPTKNADGGVAINLNGDDAPDRETMEKAEEECGPLLENAVTDMTIDPEREAEMREQMLDYAQCMRDHGIDMPDPQFSSDGGRMVISQEVGSDGEEGPPATGDDGESDDDDGQGPPKMDPEFEAADEECADEVGMDVGRPGQERSVNSEDD